MTAPRVIYLGIRTEKSAAEVGGWSKVDQMGFRDAVIYDTATRKYHNYTKSEVTDLIAKLQAADLVVGFSQLNFDYKVLSTYTETNFETLPNFDMLDKIEQNLNYRVSRDNLAQNTFSGTKNEKAYPNVADRVEITKKLFAHACREGYLLYENKLIGGKDRCDTSSWAETARNLSKRNKFLAEIKVLSEKNISENPDNSIPNAPIPPINPWKDKVEVNINSPFPRDHKHSEIKPHNSTTSQVNIGNESDIKESQHIVERSECESSIAEISKKTQFTEVARQIYDQTKNRHAREWYAYNEMARLHGSVISFHQFMVAIGRVSNYPSPKNNAEKSSSRLEYRSEYIEGYGTLVGKRENGRIVQIYKIPLCRSAYEACIQSGKRDEMS